MKKEQIDLMIAMQKHIDHRNTVVDKLRMMLGKAKDNVYSTASYDIALKDSVLLS